MPLIEEHYLSVTKAAELLKVSKSTLWRWIGQGDLPAYRFGHRRVPIKEDDLDRLLVPTGEKKGRTYLFTVFRGGRQGHLDKRCSIET